MEKKKITIESYEKIHYYNLKFLRAVLTHPGTSLTVSQNQCCVRKWQEICTRMSAQTHQTITAELCKTKEVQPQD